MREEIRHNGLDGAKLETLDLWEDPRRASFPARLQICGDEQSLALALKKLQVYFPTYMEALL